MPYYLPRDFFTDAELAKLDARRKDQYIAAERAVVDQLTLLHKHCEAFIEKCIGKYMRVFAEDRTLWLLVKYEKETEVGAVSPTMLIGCKQPNRELGLKISDESSDLPWQAVSKDAIYAVGGAIANCFGKLELTPGFYLIRYKDEADDRYFNLFDDSTPDGESALEALNRGSAAMLELFESDRWVQKQRPCTWGAKYKPKPTFIWTTHTCQIK